jgi:hypothetical protein
VSAALIAALIVAFILNPLSVLGITALAIWAARRGVLTLRKPPRPAAPKEPQP